MRQIGDLLVGIALVMVLAAAVYFTPRFVEYMSAEGRELQAVSSGQTLALSPSNVAEGSR